MFGSEILEVAIGVIFVILLVSLLCSAVREGIESLTKTRAAYLEYGIRGLLHDETGSGLAGSFFNHPLIKGLYAEGYQPGRSDRRPGLLALGKNLPSYIPARNFALTLLDMAARGQKTDIVSSDPRAPSLSIETVRANVLNLGNEAVQRVLLTVIDSAQGDLDRALANVERWYASAMERVGGWYKRSTQWIIFWIALVIGVGGNIDTLTIASYLYRNDGARAAIVESAHAAVALPESVNRGATQIGSLLADLRLPIGWASSTAETTSTETTPTAGSLKWADFLAHPVTPLVGWLLTALAATLGAPFWFDVLKRVMVVRGTVKPTDENPDPFPTLSTSRTLTARVTPGEARAAAVAPLLIEPRDATSNLDSCESRLNGQYAETPDDQLPIATGGVA